MSAPTPAPKTAMLYDGATGAVVGPAELARRLAGADVVFFGELHGHPVGAAWERKVLEAMAAQDRPVALALEFFERDTQADLDAYLAGTLDADAFHARTKRAPDYDETHGPLVEIQRRHGWPVVAANAPRRLVRAWREAEGGYEDWRAALPEADRALVARSSTQIRDDAYWERFAAMMGDHADSFFSSQSLWDDTMAESIADEREASPVHRVLLVVGGFHVAERLGTVKKLLLRRPQDRVLVVVMQPDADPRLPFRDEDRGAGDLVLKVPPPEPPPSDAPNPHARPKPAHPETPPARPEP